MKFSNKYKVLTLSYFDVGIKMGNIAGVDLGV